MAWAFEGGFFEEPAQSAGWVAILVAWVATMALALGPAKRALHDRAAGTRVVYDLARSGSS